MNRDFKHMDEVFRERFRSFEAQPPEQVWDRIKASLPNNTSGTLFSNPVSLATLAALLLIALIVGLNVIKQDNGIPDRKNPISKQITNLPSDNTHSGNPIQDQLQVNPDHITPPSLTENNKSQYTEGPVTSFGKTFPPENLSNTAQRNLTGFSIPSRTGSGLSISSATGQSAIKNIDHPAKPTFNEIQGKIDYKFKPQWLLGIHFNPEVMFYPDDNVPNQSAYHFDLTTMLQFSDFFVETGIGLNFSKDEGGYTYNYQKYLGTYDDVYEVTFDSTENGIIPVYHTSPVNVYDSVKESFHAAKNRYTYLEIPVLFGFRKETGRVSWFVKGGPAISFLIHKKIPEMAIQDNDLMLGINENRQPERLNSNVQLLLSAGIEYRIHKHISLSCEPMFRYYLTSAYERTYIRSRHTYTAGLRVGLLYNF